MDNTLSWDEWWSQFKCQCDEYGIVLNVSDPGMYKELYYDEGATVDDAVRDEIDSSEE